MDDNINGHLLLRKAEFDSYTRNMIFSASSGKYDVNSIANSLRQAFRDKSDKPTTPSGYNADNSRGQGRGRGLGRGRGRVCGRARGANGNAGFGQHASESQNKIGNPPSFMITKRS